MYGMIHRGMRQMVIDRAGQAQWDALEQRHEIGPAELISANVYDDALTINMLAAAADCLGLEVTEALEAFGRYWIRFAERGSFGAILDFTGQDLASFIANLDRMHQAVQVALPQARVPSFTLAHRAPGRLRVRYSSDRAGLEPFVTGLFKGLLERFGHEGAVEQVAERNSVAEFDITYNGD